MSKARALSAVALVSIVMLAVSLLALAGLVSCADQPGDQSAATDAIVKVWQADVMVATGLVVDGGKHVLTVLEYRESVPADLEVAGRDGSRRRVSVETVDFRTGATLLKVDGGPLSAPVSPVPVAPSVGQQVVVRGWSRPVLGAATNDDGRPVLGDPTFRETAAEVVTGLSGTPPRFRVKFPGVEIPSFGDLRSGDVLTDAAGRVLGLASDLSWGLIPPPVPAGFLPDVIGIGGLLELMSPGAGEQIWARGPSAFNLATPNGESVYTKAPDDYAVVAQALQEAANGLGAPLDITEVQAGFTHFPFGPVYGRAIVAVYARPIELRRADGMLVGKANWVIVHRDRPGKPDALLYGTRSYEAEGAFEVKTDATAFGRVIYVDETATASGVTIALKTVEITARDTTFELFSDPTGYVWPTGPTPPTGVYLENEAEYSIDGGPFQPVAARGGSYRQEGMYTSFQVYDPLPAGARELVFRVTKFFGKPGPWEFTVSLG